MSTGSRLTALEASFLAMERPGLPMHIAAVVLLEPGRPLTMPDLRRGLARRLHRLPRFRDRVAGGSWSVGRPRWERVGRIDLARHLFHHRLPAPGGMSQLNAMCAVIHERTLSRDRPLWEIHLIDGLRNHGQAVLIKMHHAITDGIAGVNVAEILLDRGHKATAPAALPCPRFAGPMRPSLRTAVEALLGVAATAASGPIALPGPFNGPVGPRRSFATATIPYEAISQAKQRYGGTVDDVYVAIVTEGLRRYLEDSACPDVPRALRAMLPVSTRDGASTGLGNHVTAVFLDLPMAELSFGELMRVIATSKASLRGTHAATGAALVVGAAGLLPNPVHSAVVQFTTGLRCCNLVLSDVPAPDQALSLNGRGLHATFPLMPLGASIGLSVAALRQNGNLGVGITADPDLVPNVQAIADAIEVVVADLARSLRPRASLRRAA